MSATPTPANEPDFGPTLPQLLRRWLPRLRRWQQVLLGLGLLAIVVAISASVFKSEVLEQRNFQQTPADAEARGLEPVSFNFDHSRAFKVTKPKGSYVQIEQTKDGVLVSRMRVSPVELGPQRGQASGYLPLRAVDLERQARRRYPGFRLQFEGRSRVNFAEGYQFAFNARLVRPGRPPRQLFGRTALILEPYDFDDPAKPYPAGQYPERGVLIELLATTLDTTAGAPDIGDTGKLKTPFRTFRFGD